MYTVGNHGGDASLDVLDREHCQRAAEPLEVLLDKHRKQRKIDHEKMIYK
jgi:hypothetical protein